MAEQQTNKLTEILRGFHGTEGYHKLTLFGNFVCTDGVLAFAEAGKAFWAVDLIASYQMERNVRKEEFQAWKIFSRDKKFIATATDGNRKILVKQDGYTDLEEGVYEFFLTGGVLMLTSEY